MNNKILLTLLINICGFSLLYAQNYIGLWEIKKVTAGDFIMTPVAKWIKINADKTYTSGNGWLQNSEGTWTFDEKENTYLPKETNGIVDPFGAFKISFTSDKMIWQRDEGGMQVTVELIKINKMPKSYMDKIIGLWQLKEHKKEGQTLLDKKASEQPNFIFIKWSKKYVARGDQDQVINGLWFMDDHKPEITFFQKSPFQQETWKVEILEKETILILSGLSESNKGVQQSYTRLHKFP